MITCSSFLETCYFLTAYFGRIRMWGIPRVAIFNISHRCSSWWPILMPISISDNIDILYDFPISGFLFCWVDALNLAGLFPCFLENLNLFWWISSCFLPSGVCVCRLGAFEPCAWPGLSCRLAQALQRDTIYHADGGKPTCFQDGFWIMLPTYFPASQLLDLFGGCYKWFKQHILGYRDVIGISWG